MQVQSKYINAVLDNRYKIQQLIAHGGMASVYLATDLRLGRDVAVKIMHEHLSTNLAFKRRFIQEARSAAKLTHPNLVNIFDQSDIASAPSDANNERAEPLPYNDHSDPSLAYIVMEYVKGFNLRTILRGGRLQVEDIVNILIPVLEGLQAVHSAGMVHRDIKPENILISQSGDIKLADFGLARAGSTQTADSALLGTIAYLAPEIISSSNAGIQSDIYSVGILLYELLTGKLPFAAKEPLNIAYKHTHEHVPLPSTCEGVTNAFDALVWKATQKNKVDRYQNAAELLQDLKTVADTLGIKKYAFIPNVGANNPVLPVQNLHTSKGTNGIPIQKTKILNQSPHKDAPTRPAKMRDPKRKKRKKLAFLLIPFILLLLLGAGGTLWYTLGPGGYVLVPDVKNLDLEHAKAQINKIGLTAYIHTQDSLSVPKGAIIDSVPTANSSVQKGSAVRILVSTGPKEIALPNIRNMQLAAAQNSLTSLGFKVQNAVEEFSSSIPKGNVVGYVDSLLKVFLDGTATEGSTVRLATSLGAVPSVVGQTEEQAAKVLTDAKLKFFVEGREHSDSVPQGNIISQAHTVDPMRPGAQLNVVVSLGPRLEPIPNVVGKKLTQAIEELRKAGFTPQHKIPASLVSQAVVSKMTPSANTKVKRGTQVTLNATFTF